jgi:adenosylcobyric acid synthase
MRPMLAFADGRLDGAVSLDGRIAGCYVHGLFADDRHRADFLARIGAASDGRAYEAFIDATLDALAAHLAAHIDCDRLLQIARAPSLSRAPEQS